MAALLYGIEADLDSAEFVDVLNRSGLGVRRPVDDLPRVAKMIQNANLIVTARDHGKLIGVARSVTDFAYCCYLSDLAVAESHQGLGVGKELINRTHDVAGRDATLILLEAPIAKGYYEHIGFTHADNCFIIPGTLR